MSVNIMIDRKDSVRGKEACTFEHRFEARESEAGARHPMRGMLLKKLSADSTISHHIEGGLGGMVMHRIRMSDSTGEFADYEIITWQNGDTMIRGLASKPQFDVLAGNKMALKNENYRADLFSD